MTESRPVVTVGIPVYNGEHTISAAIESVVAQTYGNVELLVADNGSEDGTRRICDEWARRDSRIRVLPSDRNRGATWNHNRLVHEARGEFFMWCGADDMLLPDFVEACTSALIATPEAVLAFTPSLVIDESGRRLSRPTGRLPVDAPDAATRFAGLLDALAPDRNPFYSVIRRDLLLTTSLFGARLAADRCLLIELCLRGPFVQLEQPLFVRRIQEAQRTRSDDDDTYLYLARHRPMSREWGVLRFSAWAINQAPVSIGEKLRMLRLLGRWGRGQRSALTQELVDLVRWIGRRLGANAPSRRQAIAPQTPIRRPGR